MFHTALDKRSLPTLKSRTEMLNTLLSEEYGILPVLPENVTFVPEEYPIPMWTCAHSLKLSTVKRVRACMRFGEKDFSFPIYVSVPTSGDKHPFFVSVSRHREITDDDFPTEILARDSFAIVSFCFADIISEGDSFADGIGAILYPDGKRGGGDAGKIALWAWAMQRALDYALTDPALDAARAVALGHGDFGSAALLAAAFDTRFTHVFANGTGAGGAALFRGKQGERAMDLAKNKASLFCPNFVKHALHEADMPFDQHYLLSAVYPRRVYLGNRASDTFNDPESVFLAAVAASGKENCLLGMSLPDEGETLTLGHIGLHMRGGEHPLSRADFAHAVDFILGRPASKSKAPSELLKKRALPALTAREEMLYLLQKEEYGFLPPPPDALSFAVENDHISSSFCAGKAECRKVDVTVKVGARSHTFTVFATIPRKAGRFPFFVCPTFEETVVGRYLPVEEIIDHGYAVLSFFYQGVTKDNTDFKEGLAGLFYTDKERGESDPSKIALWAWACQRVLDYAETEPKLDMSRAAVCGHSRLGKTALLAAATDTRFALVHSNCSGYGGASCTGGELGETNMPAVSRWFCYNYKRYFGMRPTLFDQHFLIAAIAPRFVSVVSAYEDTWANPESEYLSCVAATPAFEAIGCRGLVAPDRLPRIGDTLDTGHIGYRMREGLHYFGREDWQFLLSFADKKFKK